jgi:hypothetical protein
LFDSVVSDPNWWRCRVNPNLPECQSAMEVAEAVAAVIEAGGEVGDGPLSLEDISALVEESVATEVAAQEKAAYAESLRAGFADEEV